MPPPVIPHEELHNNQNEYREHDDKRGPSAWRTRDKERDYRERERG